MSAVTLTHLSLITPHTSHSSPLTHHPHSSTLTHHPHSSTLMLPLPHSSPLTHHPHTTLTHHPHTTLTHHPSLIIPHSSPSLITPHSSSFTHHPSLITLTHHPSLITLTRHPSLINPPSSHSQAYRTQTTQFTDATVLVYVNDVNEQPYWPQSDYITYLSERAEVGDIVYHLTAQDIDVVSSLWSSLLTPFHCHGIILL